ncbi:hypothetical protein SCANM63S_00317 [Streptomyces canarius]
MSAAHERPPPARIHGTRFGILGPVEIRTDDGTPLDPGGPRPRALLTLLLLDAGRAVSVERLLDGLYDAEPPAGVMGALQSLGITGEVLVPVPPLPEEPAVRLLLDRARAVRPDFDGHARVAETCRALDGLPLAIELAAARLRTLSVDELADRLHDRFRVLARGDRAKAPRHRTLRAVVEWSWELLDAAERDLASRLTVFAGGATLAAVAAVCGVPYPEDPLASLVEKSFLEMSDGRYRMLETIRAFAAESLTGPRSRTPFPPTPGNRAPPPPAPKGPAPRPASRPPVPAGCAPPTPPTSCGWPSTPSRSCAVVGKCPGWGGWPPSRAISTRPCGI